MNQVDNLLKLSLTNKKSQLLENNSNAEVLNQWEQKLLQKEQQLIQKEKKLKEKENQLSQKEDLLVKKELDLNERMMKYSGILEQIIAQKQTKSDASLLPLNSNDRSYRNKNINEYQNRVINLLNTIRSNSQQQQQLIHQQSYMGSTLELTDDRFNKSSKGFLLL
ncbi:unnamed protein product (macronuclear) [Paramecium tetraurelia]|uniref:Uncharacterized protein n=1 Tax=Paramecium tetraurelia TaxID=5888 RepID=A0DRD7_PARTE|nr:uncharacterized protein GSPATT00019321001 [Paramecium tetraurelia]CAK85604.1 unnamed protein product [Paramecium tetraurelia]|eukprot:XP_001453001.1 hypothetical protein (macronuclear) [Paramecium tetraurelia strain d4-2]